jgi:hypothetical protein
LLTSFKDEKGSSLNLSLKKKAQQKNPPLSLPFLTDVLAGYSNLRIAYTESYEKLSSL